jgi:hypothetical protein
VARPWTITILLALSAAVGARAATADPADDSGLDVEAPAPVAAHPTATLHIHRSGEGMARAERATVVLVGAQRRRVEPGKDAEITIAADAQHLTRIVVAGRPLLVHLAPGAQLWLLDDPCTSWRLDGSWLDSNDAQPPDAYCAEERQACRAGFADGSRPRLARDPVCTAARPGADVKRCVRLAQVRARGATPLALDDDGDGGPVRLAARYQAVHWLDCAGITARIDTDAVRLAIGPVERWTLFVGDDGRIGGTWDGPAR